MKRKLAWFGLGFAGAELFAAYMPPLVLVPAAALLVLLLILFRRRCARVPLLGAAAGLCCFSLFWFFAVSPVQKLAGQTVTCTVVVENDAETSFQEGKLRGTLRVQSVGEEKKDFLVYCEAFPARQSGERFTAQFRLASLERDRYRMNYLSDGIFLQAEYLGNYVPLEESREFRFQLFQLRKTLAARLQRWLPRDLGELETAMLLGDRSVLRDTTQDLFRTAGVSHLLAVSGLHVALLCGVLIPGRKRRFLRPVIVLRAGLVWFYMLLTGMPVSVQRAGLVFLLALMGDFFLQPVDLMTSTGAAAILLSLQNAYAPCDVGFQLSFSAVLGVQIAAELSRWEQKRLCSRREEAAEALHRMQAIVLRVANDVQVAALATLATLPVLLIHDMTASGVGVLSNLLVVWMLRYLLLLGLMVLVLSIVPLLAPLMHMASLILAVCLKILFAVVSWCASLPVARINLPARYTLLVLVILGVLALLFRLAGRMAWFLPAAMVCSVTAFALGIWAQRDVVTIALVGAANNPCTVCLQNGRALVLFRGGESNLRAVRQYLAQRGEEEIDLLVDLRQNPETLSGGEETIVLEEQSEMFASYNVLDDVVLDLYHKSSGNLAVLGVGDRHVAVMTGKVDLEAPLYVDVFCAAGSLPESVQSNTILSCSRAPSWLEQTDNALLLYGEEEPEIVIRPGKSMIFEEVEQLALQ